VADGANVELCITDPGLAIDLYVTTDSNTMTLVWYGDMPLNWALGEEAIMLDGPRALCSAFPSWLRLNLLAEIPRRQPQGGHPAA